MAEAKEGAPSRTGKDAKLIFPCSGSIKNDTPRHLHFPDVGLHLHSNTSGENTSRVMFPSIGHWLRFHSDIEQLSMLNEWVEAFEIVIDAEFILDHVSDREPVSLELVADNPAPEVTAESDPVPADTAGDQEQSSEQASSESDGLAGEEGSATGDDVTDAQASGKGAAKSAPKPKK